MENRYGTGIDRLSNTIISKQCMYMNMAPVCTWFEVKYINTCTM